MRTTTATDNNVIDINYLLHPGTAFNHPKDVLAHTELSVAEKRAILATWASDAAAIASHPGIRGDLAKALGPVMAAARKDFDIAVGDVDLHTVPIKLDLMNPACAFRYTLDS